MLKCGAANIRLFFDTSKFSKLFLQMDEKKQADTSQGGLPSSLVLFLSLAAKILHFFDTTKKKLNY